MAAKKKSSGNPKKSAKKSPKKTASAKKIDATVRGEALVERAIATIPIRTPKPVAAKVLAKLSLGGKPLPPSLRRWLAHHHALPRPFGTKLLEGEGLTPTP